MKLSCLGKKQNYTTRVENITKCPINHNQLQNSSLLTQMTTKMIEKHAENNVR